MEDKFRTDIDDTITYYDHNSVAFVESTINVDVSELYRPFEELLRHGDKILDLGCGSGRDSRYFAQQGYVVVAVDPSQAMCEQTRTYACVPVYRMKAEEMQFSNEFDAVWACASLLHVSRDKQEVALCRIANSLKNGGIIYCSWKYGDQDRIVDGRDFTDMNEIILRDIIKKVTGLIILNVWITCDVRDDKHTQKWLNALLVKSQ